MPQTTINGNIIVINVHLDYLAGTFSDFLDKHMEKEVIYWPNHSQETCLSNQEEEQVLLLGIKFASDHHQSQHYCRQLPPRLRGRQAQWLLW